ncbi:MAG: DsbA family protein, partial [Caulobacter sp.]
MTKSLEFLFDVGSPTTYLAHKRIPGLIERTGAEVIYVPVLLGGIFKATGNASPVMVPAKGAYMGADMARFAK